jgi:SAM-dependent methyltransferase
MLFKPTLFVLNKLGSLSADKKVAILTIILQQWIALEKTPSDSLKFLLKLDRKIYSLTSKTSKRYGGELHTKHKHIGYHEFFIEHVSPGDYVLDVGCGNGFLSYDVVTHVDNVKIIGIDMNKYKINLAKKNFKHPNLNFVLGNALIDLPDETFDVIILSNVLEHIEHRIDFLLQLKNKNAPSKYLIRVPIFERDWRVPLRRELGLDYRLDPTHYIEYTAEDFFAELESAGLKAETYEIRWGEIWAAVKPI